MVYQDMPIVERIERIHSRGLAAEIWDWSNKDLPAIAATGARITSMTGYLRGTLHTPDGAAELLATMEQSIAASRAIGTPNLNLHGTGLGEGGLPVEPVHEVTPAMWEAAHETLTQVAALGARENVTFVLENLNLDVDHPGVPFARAHDTLALVSKVNSPNLKLNLDLYHAQIGEGNLIELVEKCLPWIGEIQLADVPGRCEPGTGEINYANIAKALARMGYQGVVGMEAFASGDSDVAIDRFVEAFTI
jgi:hydroxypyruvate isomerase